MAETESAVAFLLPRPARGRDAAERGMNKPPPRAGVPVGRPELSVSRLSSVKRRVLPLNVMGDGCSNSFPASYLSVNFTIKRTRTSELTAGDSSSAIASFLSSNTSTRCTFAIFSNVCCRRPSWVPIGNPRILTDRLRTSSGRRRPGGLRK